MRKRWFIYILEGESGTDYGKEGRIVLRGPDSVWWYPYEIEGYVSEEDALQAIEEKSSDNFVILPVYRI